MPRTNLWSAGSLKLVASLVVGCVWLAVMCVPRGSQAQSTINTTSCNAQSCEGFIDYITTAPDSPIVWIRLANVGINGFGQYSPGNCTLNGNRYIHFEASLPGGDLVLSQVLTAYSTQQKTYYILEPDANNYCRISAMVMGNY